MKLPVYSTDGTSSDERDFSGIIEFEGDTGLYALKQTVVALMANRRQGTRLTKNYSAVNGTGKKPFRQKGTGRARQGSWKAPQMRGGAVAHGPIPQDWSQKVNKKVRKLALQRAVFDRVVDGDLLVIERFEVGETPSTSGLKAVIDAIAPEGRVAIVDDTWGDVVSLSARNIDRVTLIEASSVNTCDLCNFDKLIFSEKGIDKLIERLNATVRGSAVVPKVPVVKEEEAA